MSRRMVLVYRGRVIDVVVIDPTVQPYASDLQPSFWTDTTDLLPQPQIGWAWNGTAFDPP
jgi:hypothetical protein